MSGSFVFGLWGWCVIGIGVGSVLGAECVDVLSI